MHTKDRALRLIGLTRKSRGEDEGTHADQRGRIEMRCATEGWTLVRCDTEHQVSGAKSWRDREMGRAVQDVADGRADGIIVAYQDRISRENMLATAELWTALEVAGAVLISCDGCDSRDEDGEFNFGLNALLARKQWRNYQRRSNDGRKRAVDDGVHGGDRAPLGYLFSERESGTKNVSGNVKHGPLVEDPETGPRIVLAFEARAAGRPWSEIVKILGVKSPGGARSLLTNRVYLGEARSGEYVNPGAHPALVCDDLFDRVQWTFPQGDGRTKPKRRGADKALLARVLVCDTCGRRMTFDASIGGYRCKNLECTARACITAHLVEPVVLWKALTWHALLNDRYQDAHSTEHVADAAQALAAALAERDEVEATDGLSALRRAQALTEADAAVQAAEARLREAEASGGWLGMNTDAVQRRLFGEVPADETFRASCSTRITDKAEARDFVQQILSVRVKAVGRGYKVPAEDRIVAECIATDAAIYADDYKAPVTGTIPEEVAA